MFCYLLLTAFGFFGNILAPCILWLSLWFRAFGSRASSCICYLLSRALTLWLCISESFMPGNRLYFRDTGRHLGACCMSCFLTSAQCDILSKEYSHVILQGRIKVTQLPGIKTVNQKYIMTSLRNVLKIITRQAFFFFWTVAAIKLCLEFWLPAKICTHSPQLCVEGLFACFVLQRSWLNFMCWSDCDSPWGCPLARL